MFIHYLKIAFRNLWKYKTQTLISIAGLAVGFVCFSLAAMWIRYEKSYDSFYKDAERIYLIRGIDNITSSYSKGADRNTVPYALPFYLERNCPEVELITSFHYKPDYSKTEIKVGENSFQSIINGVESSFLEMFEIQILSGNIQEIFRGNNVLAITEKAAKKMFGDTDVIGKTVVRWSGTEFTIIAVIKDFPAPSNFYFDFLEGKRGERTEKWNIQSDVTFIKLHSNVNIEDFANKIANISVSEMRNTPSGSAEVEVKYSFEIIPIASVREKYPFIDPEVQHYHIYLFVLSGALLIICCLFNYLTLFLSRFRIRRREFAIRMVNGSSVASLFSLLFVEFIFVLIISYAIGLLLIKAILFPFQMLSQVEMSLQNIYSETLLYTLGIVLFSVLLFALTLFFFRRRNMNISIRKKNNHFYRKASIVIQIIISIGFVFCTSIMMRQLWYLHNTDIGFEYKNIAQLRIYPTPDKYELESQIRKIPGVTNAVAGVNPIFPPFVKITSYIYSKDKEQPVQLESFDVNEALCELYGFSLIKGEMLKDADTEEYSLITETAAKVLGIDDVGEYENIKVKGIIKDIHNSLPTVPPKPISVRIYSEKMTSADMLVFAYEKGSWQTVKNDIEKWMERDYQGTHYEITNCQEVYDEYFHSEEALLKILGFISIVCIVISLFGFVSLISLSCEEKRKEIAIRKVNGATVKDILFIFLKEYSLILIAGAVIAFPIAYYIMKIWLEQYAKQVNMDAWIYIAILFMFAAVIVLCVGWRVFKTSRENPAEVVKSE